MNDTKQVILELVKKYYEENFKEEKPFEKGDRITYAARVFDEDELTNLVDSSLEFWLTSGRYTKIFEQKLAEFLNIKYATLVNSGSSANLLAFMALTSPLLKERAVKRGDEIITVACGFPTTITPILQFGAVPVFVDVTIPQYNIDVNMLEKALSNKTKAVMIAHTLGNPFNLTKVKEFCDRNNLWLIEDNCDALGSEYNYKGDIKHTGTIGDIGTSSFYPPHHMTMGEGGAVYTDNPLLKKIMVSMRDWGRDCICPSGVDNLCGHRFSGQYGELPLGYDHKYTYSHFGYNLKATDMQAAIGCAQLKKLSSFIEKRIENWNYLYNKLSVIKDKIILPESEADSKPSWFGFLITFKTNEERNEITKLLEKNNIQTRMLFSGNIIRHPCFDSIRNTDVYRVAGVLENTDKIMSNSLWVGVYPGMKKEMLDYMAELILNYYGA